MLNCTPPEGSITGNADIVGPGVLSAFFATAVITIIAVVVAYLSDSLDGDFLNELDRMVIDWAIRVSRKSWAFICCRPAPQVDTTSPHISRSSQAWKEAIQQFILALSDQQLVTGLAILISGIANQKNLSGYEFSVMMSLAWFSSTTHLATLDALRTYLKTHAVIRNLRVFGIVCVFILLIYAFAIAVNVAGFGELRKVPVQCFISGSGPLTMGPSALAMASYTLAILVVASGYTVRVSDLYVEGGVRTMGVKLARYFRRYMGSSDPTPRHSNAARSQDDLQRYIEKTPTVVQIAMRGSSIYNRSFLSSLSSIAFSFSYGVSQVALYRWELAPSLTSETNYMGFGQIMAIFLLVLPFLTAGETYYGYVEKRSSSSDETFSQQSGRSHDQVRTPFGSPRDSVEQNAENNPRPPPNSTDGAGGSQDIQANTTNAFGQTELNYGLFWFVVSFGRSVALGVLLNSASIEDTIAVVAFVIFALSVYMKVVQGMHRILTYIKQGGRVQMEDTGLELSRI
ncbi:hypothetical protein FSARC_12704 [Fusarium sarcochroum]|uniref:Uncharacterized protein n=1 Tax=Fusarium sarcochroum TaxID=1208366 RepID=A0A8H4T6M8_9HYPO|nr:hypothetical protein FSARC_12704 [Fusarium sarcochroum]